MRDETSYKPKWAERGIRAESSRDTLVHKAPTAPASGRLLMGTEVYLFPSYTKVQIQNQEFPPGHEQGVERMVSAQQSAFKCVDAHAIHGAS